MKYFVTLEKEVMSEVAASIEATIINYMVENGIKGENTTHPIAILLHNVHRLKDSLIGNDYTMDELKLIQAKFEFARDYIEEVAKMHERICKHCHNTFYSENNSQYCSSSECQREYRRILKNNREVERKNQPYSKPISSVDNYIGKTKSDLLKKTNDNVIIKSKFEETESTVKKEIRDFVEEYKADKRDPEDEEMKLKVSELKKQIGNLKNTLKREYEQSKQQTVTQME